MALTLLLTLLTVTPASAQDDPLYDQIDVYLRVPYIGMSEIEVVIKEEEAWLPVADLFNFLKIRNVSSEDLRTVSGFFIDPAAEYTIDRNSNTINYNGRGWQLEEGDIIMTETALFLRSGWFGKVFGVECNFSFRELTINLETRHELPGIRDIRIAEMRRNMTRLSGEIPVDTLIGRRYHPFRFGMADWSLYGTQQPGMDAQARANLTLGAMVAGGEATASLNYYSGQPFSSRQQTYLWRFVNNDNPVVRQIMAGKITTGATSTIYNHVIGAQITNTPTTFRRSYGTYTLTDRTEPDWTVELYVNGVLVDYVKADASGFFTFEVPLIYGNTTVRLKYYGPWGEEREREQQINIPYNFLPVNELQYSLSAGVVEDNSWSRFSRASLYWGATQFLTLGGGAEYLSSLSVNPFMPFIDASVRVTNSMLLSAVYTYGVKASGAFSYRLPANIQLDLGYAWYHPEQQAINFNYREEQKASLSIPIRLKKAGAYTRFSYNRLTLAGGHHYTTADWLLSGSFRRVSANLSTYSRFMANVDPNIYSNLSLSIRLPADILFTPQLQYAYTKRQFLTARAGLERKIFKNGYATLSYEQNFSNNLRMGEVGMRYDFSFMQAGATARMVNRKPMFVEYARGSLINDLTTRFTRGDNRTNVGRAGITVLAYLDLNANGQHDQGEPRVSGLRVRTNGGSVTTMQKDTTIRITGLEPYVKYFLELDDDGIENISWRVAKKSLAVITDPDIMKLIEVPVTVMGEAAGTVSLEQEGVATGIGRIIVGIRNLETGVVSNLLTEPDGYFSYFGLAPGSYSVKVDTAQMQRLNMVAEPDSLTFEVKRRVEGDYIDGLDFTLKKIFIPPVPVTPPEVEIPVATDTVEVAPSADIPVAADTVVVIPPVEAPAVADTVVVVPPEIAVPVAADTVEVAPPADIPVAADTVVVIPPAEAPAVADTVVVVPPEIAVPVAADTVVVTPPADLPVAADTVVVIPPVEKQVERDTSYMVIHEVVRELVEITEDYYAVQFGAFTNRLYAEIMKNKVEAALDKKVELFEEDGFWKTRITGFEDREDLQRYLPVIEEQGITEIWVIMNKAVSAEWITRMRDDSLAVVRERTTGELMPLVITGTSLQLGAFDTKEETDAMADRLLAASDRLVTLRNEGGLWKVRITGFADTTDVREFIPQLIESGFTEFIFLDEYGNEMDPAEGGEIVEPMDLVVPALPVIDEIAPEKLQIDEEALPAPPPQPRFVLHAGSYYRRADAERAAQRIRRSLRLTAEIVEEWESYKVIIPGFYTREETYSLYPELAGMGFTDIFVYEKPLTER